MPTKKPKSNLTHSVLTFKPATEPSTLDSYTPPFEVGTPLLRDPSSFLSYGLLGSPSFERKISTAVVRCEIDGELVTYVGSLEYYPEHHNVTREAILSDLSQYLDSTFVNNIKDNRAEAGIYLMFSLRGAFDQDASSIRSNMLIFTRSVIALMGPGKYEFDLSSTSQAPKVIDEIELLLRLRELKVANTTYFGVIPSSKLRDIAFQYHASQAAMTHPTCRYTSYDVASEQDLANAALKLQLDFKAALESAVSPLFDCLDGGEVLIFFAPPSSDNNDPVEFLGRIELVWSPDWTPTDAQPMPRRPEDHGLKLLFISADRGGSFVSKAMLDDDIDELVETASEIIYEAVGFLAREFDRWAQKLSPDRTADYKMSADELLSAMQFLRRIIPKLAANIG